MPPGLPFRRQYQEIARVRRVAEILAKNGLGVLIEQLGLTHFLPTFWRRRATDADPEVVTLSIPERVRLTIEELGPTYVKLGQIMSSRGDLVPGEYIEQLAKLLDAVPPVPFEEIKFQIETELGAPLTELFATFDEQPVASASIGQVHRATLADGERVVVKVQRPGIETMIEADLDLILRQARFLEKRSSVLREYKLVEIIEEFGYTLRNELDYTIEARNAERFRQNLQDDERVIIPKVHWKLSTRRVITLDALEGIKLNKLAQLEREGYNLAAIAEIGVDIYLKQIFVDGFFHADPHPANIIIVGDKIGFVDFGMVGYITGTVRENLGDLLLDLVSQDAAQVTRDIIKIGAAGRQVKVKKLERDIQRLLVQYYGVALEEIKLSQVIADIFTVAFRHRVHLPADLALLAKMLVVLESVGYSLDPDFVLVEAVQPFARRLVQERLSLRRAGNGFLRTLRQTNQLMRDLPQRVDDFWDQLEEGEITIGIDLRRLESLTAKLDVVVNRLAFSVVVAALIIGSSLIILGGAASKTWHFLGLSLPIAELSFILAGLLGAWLLISIIRSRGL